MRFRLCLLSLCALLVQLQAGTSWDRQLADTWTVRQISNGLLQIGVVQGLDGRLVDLEMRRTDWNLLHLAPPAILARPPTAVSPYRATLPYGGLADVQAPFYPGLAFSGQPYRLVIAPDANSITVEAVTQGIRLQRRMELLPDSTILRIEITLTNERDQYLDLMAHLRGDYRVDRAHTDAASGWVTAVHEETATAMLVRVPPEQLLRIEASEAEAGVTTLGILQIPRETPPGGRVTFWQEHALFSGLSRIDLVHERTVMQLTTDRPVYDRDEPIVVRVAAARPRPGEPFTAQLRHGNKTETLTITCPVVGGAQWLTWELPPPAQDGDYKVDLTAFGQTVTHTYAVRGEWLSRLDQERQMLTEQLAELSERPSLAKRTEAAMGQARLAAIDPAWRARELEPVEQALAALRADVQRWLNEKR